MERASRDAALAARKSVVRMGLAVREVMVVGGVLAGMLGSATVAQAARVAADNAGNSTYASSWATGSNDGSGFGAWTIRNQNNLTGNTSFYGSFTGDSGTNGSNNGAGINTGGRAWAMYANTVNTENAIRPFTADASNSSALTANQTVTVRVDTGFINKGSDSGNGNQGQNGVVGFSLQNSSGANRLEFFFTGGGTSYQVNQNGGVSPATMPGFTDTGLNVAVTVTGASTYRIAVTPLGGLQANQVFTTSGNLIGLPSAFDISQIRLFNFSAGSGNAANAFYNSLSITKPALSITNGATPTAYGSSLGSLAVTGSNGSYALQELTGLNTATGYVSVSGFSPVTDTQIYGLRVLVNGSSPTSQQLSDLATAIGASTTNPGGAFPAGYNLFVTYSGASLPGSLPNYFGFDLSNAAQSAVANVTVSQIAVVPEPSTLAVVGLAGLPMMRRKRK
jgi:hypothetical protein